jgi:xanthine dehydrogenase accessory factor
MRADLLLLAADLAKRGEAFVAATVVRREPPSSARVGDSALITHSGTFHGWLGGACTQPSVVAEALRALADGAPRLIALSPDPEAERRPGITALPMTCHSGGSVDIYIEPVLPAPRLVLFGTSPVAQALARLGHGMGWAVDAVDPDADRATFPEADRVLTRLDAAELRLAAAGPGAQLFAVVATMGQSDDDALMAALALQPMYLGLVASRRRCEELRQAVEARGAAREALAIVKSPAGLDIGARAPEEIALSILAEIVQRRRAAPAPDAATPKPARKPLAQAPAAQATDPVCGMSVTVAGAKHTVEFNGQTVYFCCAGCREKFLRDPHKYLAGAATGHA